MKDSHKLRTEKLRSDLVKKLDARAFEQYVEEREKRDAELGELLVESILLIHAIGGGRRLPSGVASHLEAASLISRARALGVISVTHHGDVIKIAPQPGDPHGTP